jgi:hypothetical protein
MATVQQRVDRICEAVRASTNAEADLAMLVTDEMLTHGCSNALIQGITTARWTAMAKLSTGQTVRQLKDAARGWTRSFVARMFVRVGAVVGLPIDDEWGVRIETHMRSVLGRVNGAGVLSSTA